MFSVNTNVIWYAYVVYIVKVLFLIKKKQTLKIDDGLKCSNLIIKDEN